MATYFRLLDVGRQFLDDNGTILTGGKLTTYSAGTTTAKTTYKDNAGATAHANPIVLDSAGRVTGAEEVWAKTGAFKLKLDTSADVNVWTKDDITPINDALDNLNEWTQYDETPTRASNTTFTVVGNQTSTFHVGRRLKITDSTTLYARITVTAYSDPATTVTVVVDGATALTTAMNVSGAVSYGFVSALNPSSPSPMQYDSSVLTFGSDSDVLLTHTADSGLTMSVTGNNVATLGVTQDKDDSSTGPVFNLTRNSASPADADGGGIIQFLMENDNNQLFNAAQIYAVAVDVSDGTEDGKLVINTIKAGTATAALTISELGNATFAGTTTQQHVYAAADSTYDIGATGTRWRQAYIDEIDVGDNTSLAASAANSIFVGYAGGGADVGVEIKTDASTGTALYFVHSTTTACGSVTTGSSATAFNTSSDYRLKENVVDMTGAITRLKTLKPKRFNWIIDEGNELLDGFLAHEVDEVVPQAIHGEKDEVRDGEIWPQGIDQSKLVPLLTGALQEAIAKIEALEARVTALE